MSHPDAAIANTADAQTRTSFLKGRRWAIIACDVFGDELKVFLEGHPYPPCHMETFDAGLHMRPDDMREKMQARIDDVDKIHAPEFILLLFGLCGNAAVGLKPRCASLVIARVHECIAIFLGSTARYLELKKQKPTSYFCSPGWMRSGLLPGKALYEKTRARYQERYPDDPEMVDELMDAFTEQYKAYNHYIYADLGTPCTLHCREQSRCYAKEMGWGFEALTGDPGYFRAALDGQWDDERFLVVAPGQMIAAAWDDRILKAVPAASGA